MPATGPTVDGSVRRNELVNESRILAAAIRQQENHVSAAGRQFASEIGADLRMEMQRLVQQIAGGVQAAREASQEAIWIETAAAVATGGESLPCVRYPGIQAPMDVADGFDVLVGSDAAGRLRSLI